MIDCIEVNLAYCVIYTNSNLHCSSDQHPLSPPPNCLRNFGAIGTVQRTNAFTMISTSKARRVFLSAQKRIYGRGKSTNPFLSVDPRPESDNEDFKLSKEQIVTSNVNYEWVRCK